MSIEQTQDLNGTLITRKVTLENGIKQSVIHSDDGPAVIHANGDKEWWTEGRQCAPIVRANGDKEWRKEGNLYRDNDMPTIVRANGDQEWMTVYHGTERLQRNGDRPAVVKVNGDEEWWMEGRKYKSQVNGTIVWFHPERFYNIPGGKGKGFGPFSSDRIGRTDGEPAVIHPNGDKEWWVHGVRHREAGPAVERVNGENERWEMGRGRCPKGPTVERVNGEERWVINNDCKCGNTGIIVIDDDEWWTQYGTRVGRPF